MSEQQKMMSTGPLLPTDYYDDMRRFRINRPLRGLIKPLLFSFVAARHGSTFVSPPDDFTHLPRPLIVAANHRSWEDIPRTVVATERLRINKVRFIFKAELMHPKIVGRTFEKLGGVAVDRHHPQVRGLNQVMGQLLQSGNNVAYYPEGTRVKGDPRRLGELHIGAALVAVENHVPILPLGIAGLGDKDERRPVGGRLPIVAAFGELVESPFEGPASLRQKAARDAARGMLSLLQIGMQDSLDHAYAIRDGLLK